MFSFSINVYQNNYVEFTGKIYYWSNWKNEAGFFWPRLMLNTVSL